MYPKDRTPTQPPPLVKYAALEPPPSAGTDQVWAFVDVRVFDGENTFDRATVIVEGDRIAAVGTDMDIPEKARIVSGKGRTLLPGLIDAHAHPEVEEDLEQALRLGVTTELVMAGGAEFARRMRREPVGPKRADIFSAGTPMTPPGGHGTQFAEFPTLDIDDDVGAFVRARFAEGSQFLKVIYDHYLPTVTVRQIKEAVRAADAEGKFTVAHIATPKEAEAAVYSGVHGLVHLLWKGNVDLSPATLDLMRERGVFVTPTLTLIHSICGRSRGAAVASDPYLKGSLGERARANLHEKFHFPPPPCGNFMRHVAAREKKAAHNELGDHASQVVIIDKKLVAS
jgi:hypothetical protein